MNNRGASEGQLHAIRNLARVRQLDGAVEDRLWKRLEMHDLAVATDGADGQFFAPRLASDTIDWLMARPWTPRNCGKASDPAEPGVYRKDGRIYVIREFKNDQGATVRFAREIVALSPDQPARLNSAGEEIRYQEIKAPRMQYELSSADLLPMEEFARLGIMTGTCIACGTRLEVAESIRAGYGPVCGRRQRKRIAAARQAALPVAS